MDNGLKHKLVDLYQLMKRKLKIHYNPRIVFSNDINNSKKEFGKTAYYEPLDRLIRVYITGRHPTDILRSFAHEVIHHWQNETGRLPVEIGDQNTYAQKNSVLRRLEKEAYLIGNMLFRDWQDYNRQIQNANVNVSVNENKSNKEKFNHALNNFYKKEAQKKLKLKLLKLKTGTSDTSHSVRKYNISVIGDPAIYYNIGFGPTLWYCWYWDGSKIVKKDRGNHLKNFGTIALHHFRGRYDSHQRSVSITIPELKPMDITGNWKVDLPKGLLDAINQEFNNPEINYFPMLV